MFDRRKIAKVLLTIYIYIDIRRHKETKGKLGIAGNQATAKPGPCGIHILQNDFDSVEPDESRPSTVDQSICVSVEFSTNVALTFKCSAEVL